MCRGMMNTKKSIFSYFLWILFIILNGTSLAVYLYAGILAKYFSEFSISAAIIGAVFVLLLIVFFIFRKSISVFAGPEKEQKTIDTGLAGIIPPALILAGAVVRLTYYIAYHIPIVIKNSTYYYQAVVTDSHHGLIFAVHGLTQFYTAFLHILFLVFGNEPLVGIIAQIVFYFASLVFLFFAVKMIAGYIPAIIAMAFMAFLPNTFSYVFSLSPEMAGFFFFTTGLWVAGLIAKAFVKHQYKNFAKCIPVILAGVYFAFLIYLDFYMASLLLFVFGLYHVENSKKAHHNAIFLIVCELFGTALGIASILGIMFLLGMPPREYYQSLIKLYFDQISINPWASSPDNTSMAVSLLLMGCAFFVIPGFITQKRNRCSTFILLLILGILLPVFSINSMDYQLFISMDWSILAGLGIQALLIREKDLKKCPDKNLSRQKAGLTESGEPEDQTDLSAASVSLKDAVFTVSQPLEEAPSLDKMILFVKEPSVYEKTNETIDVLNHPNENIQPVQRKEEPAEVSEDNIKEDNAEFENDSKEENTASENDFEEENADMELVENGPELTVKVKPLDNPLPLPKKHIRKDMDYSFDVPDGLMNYDHEISEADNYDYD